MIIISKYESKDSGEPLAYVLSDSMKPWVDRVYSCGDKPHKCNGWYVDKEGRGPGKTRQTTQPLNSKVDILCSVKRRNHWQRPKEKSSSLFQKAIEKISKWVWGP